MKPKFTFKRDNEVTHIQLDTYTPCNEYEKNTYGVDFKLSDQYFDAYIYKRQVEDTKKTIYKIESRYMANIVLAGSDYFFNCKEKAEKFCKKRLKESWDKYYNNQKGI